MLPSHHGHQTKTARGYSTTAVAVFCILSFFVGRFLRIPGEGGLPDVDMEVNQQTEHRKSLLEETPTGSSWDDSTVSRYGTDSQFGSPFYDNFTSFEELLEASGMMDDRPPVASGATGHSFYTVQPMQLLSWYPRAYLFPKFMDRRRCEHVISIAEPRLVPSGLAFKKGDTLASTREIRTSQGTFLSRGDDPEDVLGWIEDKIAVLTGIPAGHGEAFNVLRYENGQHYDSHYDAFAEKDYGKQNSQRVATVLVYLTDVEEGGETSFILEGRDGMSRLPTIDYKKCDTGIKYKPRAGDALLFWSINPDHSLDRHSLHGGCPVVSGTKWTMTKWIRDRCIGGTGACVGAKTDPEDDRK